MKIVGYLPKSIQLLLRQMYSLPALLHYSMYWFLRDLTQSSITHSKSSCMAGLLIDSHVLEKGITMPERRMGFGLDKVRNLLIACNNCIIQYGAGSVEVQSTLDDFYEYLMIHKLNGYHLPEDIEIEIRNIIKYRKSKSERVNLHITRKQLFPTCSSFEEFAHSRRTCRYFCADTIDTEVVKHCIDVAMTAPSACNRQSTRVKIIASDDLKEFVLNLQNGNRGFGRTADKVLLITSIQSAWDMKHRMTACVDGGIFTMNLLYALHASHIAACTLNAHFSPAQWKQIQQRLNIDKAEFPIVLIAIGNAPEELMIARSSRLKTEDIYTIL